MRTPLTICLLLLAKILFCQDGGRDFATIDRTAIGTDATDPASLSYRLTSPYKNEKEKVRAIFRWITEHISYYRNTPRDSRRRLTTSYASDDWLMDTGALKPLTERVAIKVLKDRRAYCDGYSRLFKSLCDHAGIRAEIITGYARADIDRAEEKFRSNHSWNAVYIDSSWQLVDVTWASGYISRFNEFVKHYDNYYFLTPPEQFIRHHYPDDLRWTLMKNPPPLYEFRYTPFKQRSYVKYEITEYLPTRGIIEASVGDTIYLEVQTNPNYRYRGIASDSLWDSASLVMSPVYSYVKPDLPVSAGKARYHFRVESDQVQWLHVMYNNDAVLRYRLKINASPTAKTPLPARTDL